MVTTSPNRTAVTYVRHTYADGPGAGGYEHHRHVEASKLSNLSTIISLHAVFPAWVLARDWISQSNEYALIG